MHAGATSHWLKLPTTCRVARWSDLQAPEKPRPSKTWRNASENSSSSLAVRISSECSGSSAFLKVVLVLIDKQNKCCCFLLEKNLAFFANFGFEWITKFENTRDKAS